MLLEHTEGSKPYGTWILPTSCHTKDGDATRTKSSFIAVI